MLSYITTYLLMLLYYSFFFGAVKTGFRKDSRQLKDVLAGKGKPGILLTQLIAGIIFLGIGTVTLSKNRNVDVGIFTLTWYEYDTYLWIIIAAAIIVGTLSASKKIYPSNISSHSLPSYLPLAFVIIRTLFLILYESFFRGVMLFVMIEDLGIAAAVIVNLILYALLHWFDKKERYGSVLMGFILCSVSINYHSVWPAIIIHLSLALSHEVTLLINNKSLIKKSWL